MKKARNPKSSDGNVDFYLDVENTRFVNLLITTRKYKDFFWSIEALLSLIMSAIACLIFYFFIKSVEFSEVISVSREILINLFSALIGMLGFIIGGLAILTGTISNKVMRELNKLKKIKSLIGILYSFYFTGFIIGVTILVSISVYLLSFVPSTYFLQITFVWVFIIGYLFSFSIIYSIALLGSCLRVMLINYKFTSDEGD